MNRKKKERGKYEETLHATNDFVRIFKYVSVWILSLKFKIIFHEKNRPFGEYARRFNILECNEVTTNMIGESQGKSYIILIIKIYSQNYGR